MLGLGVLLGHDRAIHRRGARGNLVGNSTRLPTRGLLLFGMLARGALLGSLLLGCSLRASDTLLCSSLRMRSTLLSRLLRRCALLASRSLNMPRCATPSSCSGIFGAAVRILLRHAAVLADFAIIFVVSHSCYDTPFRIVLSSTPKQYSHQDDCGIIGLFPRWTTIDF